MNTEKIVPVLFAIIGCIVIATFLFIQPPQNESVITTPPPCRVVIDKGNEIDNRFSGTDFLIGNGSVTKSQTVYFLVFEGGTTSEVSRDTYYGTEIGSEYCGY